MRFFRNCNNSPLSLQHRQLLKRQKIGKINIGPWMLFLWVNVSRWEYIGICLLQYVTNWTISHDDEHCVLDDLVSGSLEASAGKCDLLSPRRRQLVNYTLSVNRCHKCKIKETSAAAQWLSVPPISRTGAHIAFVWLAHGSFLKVSFFVLQQMSAISC